MGRRYVTEDSIETSLGRRVSQVAAYKYVFRCRGKNAFGAKVLSEYFVETDPAPNFKVINVADTPGQLFVSPNNFPGYHEMIVKYL